MFLRLTFFVLLISSLNLMASEIGCASRDLTLAFGGKNNPIEFMQKLQKLSEGKIQENANYDHSDGLICNGKMVYPDKASMAQMATSIKFNIYAPDGSIKKSFRFGKDQKYMEELKAALSVLNPDEDMLELAENGMSFNDGLVVFDNPELSGTGMPLKDFLKKSKDEEPKTVTCIYSSQPYKISITASCSVAICRGEVDCIRPDKKQRTTDASCMAKSDGSCPSATECYEDPNVVATKVVVGGSTQGPQSVAPAPTQTIQQ